MKYLLVITYLIFISAYAEEWVKLEYDSSKAPADNPLKGFVPYAGDGLDGQFPHSMEWFLPFPKRDNGRA